MNLLAYIDPSAITILATSITAAVVAVGASLTVVWRRFKNKLHKNDDPSKNKDAEGEVHVLDESALEVATVADNPETPADEQPVDEAKEAVEQPDDAQEPAEQPDKE